MEWHQGFVFPQPVDPRDKMDYPFTFPLEDDEVIDTHTVTVVSGDMIVDSSGVNVNGKTVIAWVTGGTPKSTAQVEYEITTDKGRTLNRKVGFTILDL